MAYGTTPKKSHLRYRFRTQPTPVEFPDDAGMAETRRHFELRTLLFQSLKQAFAERCSIGSSQLLYWNAADPSRFIAPDVMLKAGVPDHLFACWKTWERGSPEVAVEIVSDKDSTELAWDEKLGCYLEMGVAEVVRFDPVAGADYLRLWSRMGSDLIERELDNPKLAESSALDITWVVLRDPVLGRTLRVASDKAGSMLLPTPAEKESILRANAEQRVRELQEELRRRGG